MFISEPYKLYKKENYYTKGRVQKLNQLFSRNFPLSMKLINLFNQKKQKQAGAELCHAQHSLS